MSLQQIIDRRLSGKNKSIGNRERFLRRHKEQIREAVKRAVDGRGIRDIERGEEVRIPKKDLNEPVFGHGDGGVREVLLDRVQAAEDESGDAVGAVLDLEVEHPGLRRRADDGEVALSRVGLARVVEVPLHDVGGAAEGAGLGLAAPTFVAGLLDGNGLGVQYTYDHVWDVSGVGSGVYAYVITPHGAVRATTRMFAPRYGIAEEAGTDPPLPS